MNLADTSSLLIIVKYFIPFQKDKQLYNFLKEKFEEGALIMLDAVYNEAKYVSKGIILEKLDFLNDKSQLVKTTDLIPDRKFFNLIEHQFCDQTVRKGRNITATEFELEKTKFLDQADGKIILYSYYNNNENYCVLTEETKTSNDMKLFKKLPLIFDEIKVKHCNLTELLKNEYDIKLSSYLE